MLVLKTLVDEQDNKYISAKPKQKKMLCLSPNWLIRVFKVLECIDTSLGDYFVLFICFQNVFSYNKLDEWFGQSLNLLNVKFGGTNTTNLILTCVKIKFCEKAMS